MSKAAAATAPTITQEEPTRERPVDADGRVLDGWRLPLSGPARMRALASIGRADPVVDPTGWTEIAVPPLESLPVPAPIEPGEGSSLEAAPATDPTTPPTQD